MSIVVGLAVGKHRVLAGDQRVSYQDGHKYDRSPKVRKIKTGLIGFTGSVEPETKLIEALRKADDPMSLTLPRGSYEALFLSRNGRCYRIADGKSVAIENESVFAFGAAYQYAYGAIWSLVRYLHLKPNSKASLTRLARIGVKAGIHFNNTCGGRVQVKYLEVE
jgi:ATP-dependent protease HslVU (ClpYQ) peptidase subunit